MEGGRRKGSEREKGEGGRLGTRRGDGKGKREEEERGVKRKKGGS